MKSCNAECLDSHQGYQPVGPALVLLLPALSESLPYVSSTLSCLACSLTTSYSPFRRSCSLFQVFCYQPSLWSIAPASASRFSRLESLDVSIETHSETRCAIYNEIISLAVGRHACKRAAVGEQEHAACVWDSRASVRKRPLFWSGSLC